jgi:hypothetical protein
MSEHRSVSKAAAAAAHRIKHRMHTRAYHVRVVRVAAVRQLGRRLGGLLRERGGRRQLLAGLLLHRRARLPSQNEK